MSQPSAMTNTLCVCLLITIFCCTNLSLARQVPKECSKGPSYWCQNLKVSEKEIIGGETAKWYNQFTQLVTDYTTWLRQMVLNTQKTFHFHSTGSGAECGAVGHCIGTVWEKQKVEVSRNDVSDKFVRLFRQLKDIKDLINEEYLGTRVNSECHDVPYPEVAKICKENTAELQQYLYHVLVSDTSAEAMCQVIGMCNNGKLDNFVSLKKKKSTEPSKNEKHKVHLVGANRCTWGPSYWCSNFSTGRECSATKHCVDAVWTKQRYPEDNDSVCKICTDMVQQARDQLESNQTQEELKEVFEGSCKLMPIKIVAKECMKLSDDFVPELVETLASQMNPQAVCSVAGLCNSARIDRLLEAHEKKKESKKLDTHKVHLVGASHCTWGPSYWCSNFSTGRECSATKHCVERVWSKMDFPQDNDNICQICTDMVKQARDQLESNETQEELKEVFEGSCKLIPIKVVKKECIKLADDFVPELVETLASQMNPQAVCSVAGLCNNARIDQLLDAYGAQLSKVVSCSSCRQTVGVARKKFDASSYEDFLVSLLQVCGKLSSFSDSCSMLVFKYYENILAALRKDLTPQSVCHLSGQCTYKYHMHDNFDFPEWALQDKAKDDVPCEFCEQLIKHMRDTLVANTTELEFYKVLKGLCKQTGEFKDECLHLADQYYPIIYKYLVADLQPEMICNMMGLCGKNITDSPIAPLLPKELVVKAVTMKDSSKKSELIGTDEAKSYTKKTNVRIMGDESEPLPPLTIDRMFVRLPENKAGCAFCQYFLHYLQVELSDTKTEDAIRDAVEKACDRLPNSINGECHQFVDQYGPAVIALLVQEIDPASICPALGLCPQVTEVRHVAINSGKSNCALCLFAVEQLVTMLKDNRTETSIRHALGNLCTHLSGKMKNECVDFVDTYTEQLVEMLVANLNAQEVCVYLKLCAGDGTDPMKVTTASGIDKYHEKPALRGDRNNFKHRSMLPTHMLENGGDIETNEIPDDTVNGHAVKPQVSQKTVCVLCEFVMKEIDDQIKDKHNQDEIKQIVHSVCKRMPKAVRADCDQFVEKYSDLVISLLEQELEPEEVCEELKLCDSKGQTAYQDAREQILDCAVCETVVMAVKKVLSNDKVDHNIVHVIEKSCGLLPAKYNARCHTLMEIYGDSVIHLVEELGTKGVCQKIGLCAPGAAVLRMRDRGH